jgi:hypothetical protein
MRSAAELPSLDRARASPRNGRPHARGEENTARRGTRAASRSCQSLSPRDTLLPIRADRPAASSDSRSTFAPPFVQRITIRSRTSSNRRRPPPESAEPPHSVTVLVPFPRTQSPHSFQFSALRHRSRPSSPHSAPALVPTTCRAPPGTPSQSASPRPSPFAASSSRSPSAGSRAPSPRLPARTTPSPRCTAGRCRSPLLPGQVP